MWGLISAWAASTEARVKGREDAEDAIFGDYRSVEGRLEAS
jgi:hypothetical protein